tara:strand:+ start:175 stop:708 length:534 start_codon:yes stop_codon:yes gene_type:complete
LISKKYKKSLIINIGNAYLRPINMHDISQLYIDGLNDPEVHHFLVAAKNKKQDYKSISTYVKKNLDSKDAILFGFFLDNILRGTVRLHDIIDKKSFIGIVIFDKSIWGKKWGRKILLAVNNFAYRELDIKKIKAGVEFDNHKSARLFSSAGYFIDKSYLGKDKFIYIKSFDNGISKL